MDILYTAVLLLLTLQLKHFICDYPLQGQYMLGKAGVTNWVKPLATHSLVHAAGTFIVFVWINPNLALLLAFVDFVLHFIVDRLKASPNLGGRWNPSQPYFWWALGLDQMAHHVINILFVYYALAYV